MNILIYISAKSSVWEPLHEALGTADQKTDLEVCQTIERLSRKLRRPLTDFTAAVLVASSTRELSGLVSISDLLADIRTILIVPDRDKNTIARAHILRPRFLTYVDGNFNEIAAVLKKILENNDSKKMYFETS